MLPPEVERGDGFTVMKWNLKAGRSIKDLSSRVANNWIIISQFV
jgi:hypothetical protein